MELVWNDPWPPLLPGLLSIIALDIAPFWVLMACEFILSSDLEKHIEYSKFALTWLFIPKPTDCIFNCSNG